LTVCLLTLSLTQTISTRYTFREKEKKLRYLTSDNRWREVAFKNRQFVVRKAPYMMEDEYENDEEILKEYNICYLPEYTGWLVYKDLKNKQRTIEQGDYVAYFKNDSAYADVGDVSFYEKQSENRILDYFVGDFGADLERSKEEKNQVKRKGYLKMMNKFPKDLEKFNTDKDPGLHLKQYPYTLAPSVVEQFFLSNQRIVSDIKTKLGISEEFAFKDDKQSYSELVASDAETKSKFMQTLVDEIVLTTQLENDWSILPTKEIQNQVKQALESIGKKMVEPSLEQLNEEHYVLLEETFLETFNEIVGKSDINLFLRNKRSIEFYTGWSNVQISKEKTNYMMVNLKHHLVGLIYQSITGGFLHFSGNIFDAGPYMEDLKKFYGDDQNQNDFIQHLFKRMVNKPMIYFLDLWLKVYFYVSQIKDVEQVLTMYMEQTMEDEGFETLLSNGLIHHKDIVKLRSLFVYGIIQPGNTKFISIFDKTQERTADMLLV
jgi:hypothetical protein